MPFDLGPGLLTFLGLLTTMVGGVLTLMVSQRAAQKREVEDAREKQEEIHDLVNSQFTKILVENAALKEMITKLLANGSEVEKTRAKVAAGRVRKG